jgi:hypothetical protein
MSTRIKENFKTTGSYLGTIGGLIAIDGYIKDILNQDVKKQCQTLLAKNRELENRITEWQNYQMNSEANQNKVLEWINRRSNSIEIVREDVNQMQTMKTHLAQSDITEQEKEILMNQWNQKWDKISHEIQNVNTDLTEWVELILKSSNKYWDEFHNIFDTIKIFIEWYQQYLTTLTLEQKGAVSNICIGIVILFSLWSLVSIHFGDLFITNLKLEERWPNLTRILKLRKTIKNIGFIWNTLFILGALFGLFFVNILYLIYI